MLTPSSRRLSRHHRHLPFLCRRRRLPPRLLPRLVLLEGGHRQLPTDQAGLSRGIPDVIVVMDKWYASCRLANAGIPNARMDSTRAKASP